MTLPILPLAPIHLPKVWGGRTLAAYRSNLPEGPVGESFEASALPGAESRVRSGPHEGRTLREMIDAHGADLLGRHDDLPFLIKVLDVLDSLSVQIHPAEERSRRLGLAHAKTEGWVILEASPYADVGLGLLPGIDRAMLEMLIGKGTPERALAIHSPLRGQAYFLPCGTVHYATGGILLYEFQRPADVTLRLYDWGRARAGATPLPDALDAVFEDRGRGLAGPAPVELFTDTRSSGTFEGGGFRVRSFACHEGTEGEDIEVSGVASVTVFDGELALEAEGEPVTLSTIETALVPARPGRFHASGEGMALVCDVP
ncbi:MAG: type I phosphomannose isomerase catalytic subunit [Acidobacteriota bacterium]